MAGVELGAARSNDGLNARQAFGRRKAGEVASVRLHVGTEPLPKGASLRFVELLTVDEHPELRHVGGLPHSR